MNPRLPSGVYRLQAIVTFAVFALFVLHAAGYADFSRLPQGQVCLDGELLAGLVRGDLAGRPLHPDFLAFLAVGALLTVVLPWVPPIVASALTLAAMVPPLWVAWAYPVPPPLVPLEYTLTVILVLFAGDVLVAYFVETRQRALILAAFGQYVPPPVVRELARDPQALSMAGEAREVSVLFCDIRRFSTLSEDLDPRALAEMLNVYLTAMTDVLHAHRGTIDKYIGDAVMAFWGAPLRQPDHAVRAVSAALAMQVRVRELAAVFGARGWPPLAIGIGVSTGTVSVGNMGSRYRVAYTVLGDVVNLAARLEALTRVYRVDVLVSAATRAAAAPHRFREIDHVRVKGKHRATRIYEPLAVGAADAATLAAEAAALAAYYAGDWSAAASAFGALRARPDASPWYAVMHERVTGMPAPPPGWDGIVRFGGETTLAFGDAGGAAEEVGDEAS